VSRPATKRHIDQDNVSLDQKNDERRNADGDLDDPLVRGSWNVLTREHAGDDYVAPSSTARKSVVT